MVLRLLPKSGVFSREEEAEEEEEDEEKEDGVMIGAEPEGLKIRRKTGSTEAMNVTKKKYHGLQDA